jgi:acetate kinase
VGGGGGIEGGMPLALVLNPGSNSLKFELVELWAGQRTASDAKKRASAVLDDLGKTAKLRVYDLRGNGRAIERTEECEAPDMRAAARLALDWLRRQDGLREAFSGLDFAAVRVVHGGAIYAGAVRVTEQVLKDIEGLEELAPLHNKSSLEILSVLREELAATPAMATSIRHSTGRCRRPLGGMRSNGRRRTGTGCGSLGFMGSRTGTWWSTMRRLWGSVRRRFR